MMTMKMSLPLQMNNVAKGKVFFHFMPGCYLCLVFSCIDVLGDVITTYLKDLNICTDFAFSLYAGGLDTKGEIVMAA